MEVSRSTHTECQKCGTVRRPIKARGYCRRCYAIVLQLEAIAGWDLSRPETLKHYPREPLLRTHQYFEALQAGFSRQLRDELAILRTREDRRKEGVDCYVIEMQLRRLARRAGAGSNVHRHSAGFIESSFSLAQRRVLFQLLDDIEDGIPRQPLSVALAFERYESRIKRHRRGG